MPILLDIPWFRPEPFVIPLPHIVPGVTGLPIQPFGLLVAIGVLTGWQVADYRARKTNLEPSVVSDLVGHILVAGFLLGHMLDAVFYHPDKLAERPLYLFEIWNGLSSYGGFIGAMTGMVIWRWRRKLDLLRVADPVAFGFPCGWIFGRTGCFVVHDHPGIPSNFFLAVRDYRLCIDCPPGPPRHDLGLYEIFWSAFAIATFFVLARKPRKPGFFVAMLPLLYGPVRFGLDFLRAGAEQHGDVRYFGLTPGHYGSIGLTLLGVALLVYVQRRQLPPSTPTPAASQPLSESSDGAVPGDAPPSPTAPPGAEGDGVP